MDKNPPVFPVTWELVLNNETLCFQCLRRNWRSDQPFVSLNVKLCGDLNFGITARVSWSMKSQLGHQYRSPGALTKN